MAEYISLNPAAEVSGQSILGVTSGLGPKAKTILEKHGLYRVNPNNWYLQQTWLNALRDFSEGGMFDLISIGKGIATHVPLPDGVHTIQDMMLEIDKTYRANHRNCPGYTKAEVIEPHHIQVTGKDPYPNDMIYGIVWGFATRFERMATVAYDDSTPHGTPSDLVIFHVKW